jgi:GAF domain-containing protein
LNTGAATIGVLSLGSRDSTIVFTEEQINLLQAIADQAAGAIVKARLLQEAERRTRRHLTERGCPQPDLYTGTGAPAQPDFE